MRGAVVSAPVWRRTAAVAIDVALTAGLERVLRRRAGRPARWHDVRASEMHLIPLVGPSSELVREQIRSPGQRLLGIGTVDSRTGARLALWKSLLFAALSAAGRTIIRRAALAATSPERMRERQRFMREWEAISARHAEDSEARDAARDELTERYRGVSDVRGCVGPVVAVGLVSNLLRRRLAPTTEIAVRARR
jgi:hypothetical protein